MNQARGRIQLGLYASAVFLDFLVGPFGSIASASLSAFLFLPRPAGLTASVVFKSQIVSRTQSISHKSDSRTASSSARVLEVGVRLAIACGIQVTAIITRNKPLGPALRISFHSLIS